MRKSQADARELDQQRDGLKQQAHHIIADAIRRWQPVAVFAGFSGGDDSLVSTHLAMSYLQDRCKVLHINTGIGIELARHYVRETCEAFDWPLWERFAAEGEFERIVQTHGFPGPAQHNRMYQRLKERVVYAVCKEAKQGHKRRDKVMFLTGIRHDESQVRAGYKRTESKVRAQIWVNPCYHWTGQDFYDYRTHHDLPRNPVSEVLGMSGECLCGAYAHQGEKELIRLIEPATADRLDRLEAECRANGKPWGWEDAPPRSWLMEQRGQLNMFTPLCVGCQKVYDHA